MKKNTLALVIVTLIIILSIGSFYFPLSSKALEDKIYLQKGYDLSVVNDSVPVDFQFEESWLALEPGEEKMINKVLVEEESSTVILNRIIRSDDGRLISIELNSEHSFKNNRKGRFLSSLQISGQSFLKNNKWSIYSNQKEVIKEAGIINGTGGGPAELNLVNLDYQKVSNVEKPFIISFEYMLYEYEKK
ncbi:hypothetical protein [Bacillus alkalicellulosilyticus]|uniref:hypothetical protein n=1 Tax=Alkalihalobacterium alkalicellulosilyticum TaxID=1912214 RepID=UPI000996BDA3|nr:hypothetical protein [Bacillus alkalicellulosilyticus]